MIVISAPFGNHLRFAGTIPTLGTFTLKPRGGILYRLWRCLLTLRPRPALGGWTNRLGLPNPGVGALLGRKVGACADSLISVHGSTREEWTVLARTLIDCAVACRGVELNLSCPNVSRRSAAALAGDVRTAASWLAENNVRVIAKLPPVRWMDLAAPLFDQGVDWFHCCNTIPTPAGGLSGKTLKQYSLWAVEEVRRGFPHATITGGGGVTDVEDVRDYRNAGADHVAVGSMLLNPLNWRRVRLLVASEER